jgi:hypothetical protein
MSRPDRAVDRWVYSSVIRFSGVQVIAVALLLYPGIGLILPLGLGWSRVFLIEANLVGVVLGAAVSLGWLAGQIEDARRRHLIEWTSNLRLLDSEEFEWLVGELFRREGWTVRETGNRDGPDGNIDLELTRDGNRVIVQCKRWASWLVGVDDIRQFLGTLMREKLPVSAGIFVTLSTFTEQARDEATQAGLSIIEGSELYRRIDKVKRTEPCPLCETPMIFGKSDYGWWLRCSEPGCSGKRDLSADPARALELLIQPSK